MVQAVSLGLGNVYLLLLIYSRMDVNFHAGFECEEHNNPADFFLDVIMQCEDVNGSGKLITMYVPLILILPIHNQL